MTASKGERTKQNILATATAAFAKKSYDAVSLRAIARSARVDPALIHHYFGSKTELFVSVMASLLNYRGIISNITAAPKEQWGRRIVIEADRMWGSPHAAALHALFRTGIGSHPELLRNFIADRLLVAAEAALAPHVDNPKERLPLMGSQLIGVMTGRYLVKMEPLRSMPRERLADLIGPTIQRYLFDPLPTNPEPEPDQPR